MHGNMKAPSPPSSRSTLSGNSDLPASAFWAGIKGSHHCCQPSIPFFLTTCLFTPFDQTIQKRLNLSKFLLGLNVEVPGEKVKMWTEEMAQLLGAQTALAKNLGSVLQLTANSHLKQQIQETNVLSQRAHALMCTETATEIHRHTKLKIKYGL